MSPLHDKSAEQTPPHAVKPKPITARFDPKSPTDLQILRPLVMNTQIYNTREMRQEIGFESSGLKPWRKVKGNELPGFSAANGQIVADADYYFLMPQYVGANHHEAVRNHIAAVSSGFFERCGTRMHVIDRELNNQAKSHNLVFVLPASALENETIRAAIRQQYKPLHDAALAQQQGAAR